jgi:hypothetical protein
MKKQDFDPMYYNACLSCGDKEATAVVNVQKNERLGWYCAKCQHFSEAILREKTWRAANGQ